jgi:hypothetical protein
VAKNLAEHGCGALNIDGCRVEGEDNLNAGEALGRWPANVCHDGSDEVLSRFAAFGEGRSRVGKPRGSAEPGEGWGMTKTGAEYDDAGSPSRFFYCAKASKKDRDEGNNHPTVKPTALMQWLCRLITPPGGVILDPFMGSGSTGKAATRGGFGFIGIEQDEKYMAIAKTRVRA